ncbi:hypothetical protein PFFCH_05765, partial [Plasmodium falciparum FCH/4]
MEKHFISIFKKIREQLPEKERKKYTDNDKYLELRADWWTANRRQVWKAMKCATKKDKNMKCNGIPIEDYIPQRLRWMTEWAEWFCKYQSQEYDKLMKECGECKAKGEQCTNGKNGCEKCKNACEKYKEEINKWKKQWNNMLVQYVILYLETHIAAANGGTHTYSGAVEPKDKPVVDFFKELQKTIKSSVAASDKGVKPTTSPYETAAGYIHQEIGYGGCQEQTQFCEYENGVIPTTDSGTNNKNYAFKNTPKDHDDACACKSRPKPEKKTEKPKEEEDPECKTVEGILKDNNGNEQVGECKKKDFTRTYPDWQCGNINLVEDRRVCMPPRRIKLCLYYLKELKVNEETKEQDLREAFIKTAAAETFLSWQYYKSKNSMDIKKLQSGEIPEEFLRSMYFTYGDYRDICLNTDISKKEGDVSDAKGKIDAYFNKYTDTNRTKWWDTNGPEIWEGMLCALTHGVTNTDNKRKIKTDYSYKELNKSKNVTTPLEKFAERPQFLRWMIEWGEEFCRERQKKENKIKDGCIEGDGCNNTQHPCNKACTEFQDYVKKKKKEFTGQTNKFVTDASKPKADPEYSGYEYKNGVTKQGNDYLKDKCDNKKCDCMEGNVLGDNPKEKPFGIYSHEYKNKCDCLGGRHAPSAPHPPAVVPTEQEAEPPPQEAPPKKTQEPQNNECTMVENLFLNDPEKKFKDACKQKYDGKYYGWKCVPTTSDKSDGSVCVPPRRRKLYIGKIKEWADKVANTGESQTLTGGESESTSEGKTTSKSSGKDPREALRDAFIQSAAVETFFAWHEYKEEKKPPAQEGAAALLKEVTPQEDPQNKLKSGTIPTDFLRQMFYTLGDYRDILFGDTSIVEAALSPSEKEKMKEIQKKIDEILEKSGNENSVKTVQSSRTTGPHSVKSHPNSGKDRKTWWNENAQHIWEGMICALTYKESENGDKTIVKDDKVYNKIFGTTPNNPIPKDNLTPGPPVTTNGTTGTPTGTYNDRYKYQTAKLEEENSGENTPLSKFVLRPPYFRYLEEWGQNFCKERKKRLAQIKKDCEQGGGRCSGYGENCDDNLLKKYTIVSDFNCPRCGTSCSFYKKWINTKRDEFNKQSNAFTKQKTDAHNNNGFCEKEGKCETAGDFLEKLKTGPCKNDSGEHKTGDDYIKFDDESKDKTFGHENYCDPCSQFKIDCKKANCTGDENKEKCNPRNGTINATDIGNGVNSAEDIDMLVSDNIGKGFHDGLEACENAHIFEGIRKDEWKCGKVCGYNVCKPENVNGKKGNGNQIIIIRALFKIWLEYFFKDYNKIRKKLKSCMNSSDATPCIKGCAEEWLKTKKAEWGKIKKHYETQNEDDDIKSFVKNILEFLQSRTEFKNAIKPCKSLDKFEESCGLNSTDNSQNGKDNDLVLCMLNKLEKKISECTSQSSGSPEAQCDSLAPIETPPEEPLEEEEENQVKAPEICKDVIKETAEEKED